MPNPRTPLALLTLMLLMGCSTTVVQEEPTVTVTYKETEQVTVTYCEPLSEPLLATPCDPTTSGGSLGCKGWCISKHREETRNKTETMPAATFDLKMKYEHGFADSVLSFQ